MSDWSKWENSIEKEKKIEEKIEKQKNPPKPKIEIKKKTIKRNQIFDRADLINIRKAIITWINANRANVKKFPNSERSYMMKSMKLLLEITKEEIEKEVDKY